MTDPSRYFSAPGTLYGCRYSLGQRWDHACLSGFLTSVRVLTNFGTQGRRLSGAHPVPEGSGYPEAYTRPIDAIRISLTEMQVR